MAKITLPKFNLLYYKALLDKCFIRFFDENNDFFTKDGENYVLSKGFSMSLLQKTFAQYLKDELLKHIKPISILEPNFYFIIGACEPSKNILLQFKDDKYFPEKLNKIINSEFQLKYILKEKDIKIDLVRFNEMAIDLFNKLFTNERYLQRLLGKEHRNVIFVQHSQLDCYSMFKVIKHIYGRSNCWNIHREKFYDMKSPLVAVNDLIDRYVKNKLELNHSEEFKKIVAEVQQFLSEKVKNTSFHG